MCSTVTHWPGVWTQAAEFNVIGIPYGNKPVKLNHEKFALTFKQVGWYLNFIAWFMINIFLQKKVKL